MPYLEKNGRIASEEVTLEIRCKCIPVLLYGTEARLLNKSDLSSLDFVINRLFMKLFKKIVELCQYQFGFEKPSVLWKKRVGTFNVKLNTSDNAFCKLTSLL